MTLKKEERLLPFYAITYITTSETLNIKFPLKYKYSTRSDSKQALSNVNVNTLRNSKTKNGY